eukprot:scaffold53346_cov51-Phaeocystis_antarctica.AAC.3
MEMSVFGCRPPRASRRPSSASRHSGSAAAKSALDPQQPTEVVDGAERVRVPTAEGLAVHLQHLAEQRLGLVELALDLQLRTERTHGEAGALAIRALGLEPCA